MWWRQRVEAWVRRRATMMSERKMDRWCVHLVVDVLLKLLCIDIGSFRCGSMVATCATATERSNSPMERSPQRLLELEMCCTMARVRRMNLRNSCWCGSHKTANKAPLTCVVHKMSFEGF